MEQNTPPSQAGMTFVVLSWGTTIIVRFLEHSNEIITKGNISFALSCVVSIMAIRHYYLQNKNK